MFGESMKRNRIWPLLIAMALLLAGLAAGRWELDTAGSSDNGGFETYSRHYVMITGRDDADFWDRVYGSAQEEGKRQDAYVERFGENLAEEYSRDELLKLAVQAAVDGIIVPGDEEESTVGLIDEAVEEGIPIVTVMQDSTGSLRQCFVGNNSYNIGQEYGRQILEILNHENSAAEMMVDGSGADAPGRPVKVLVLIDESRRDTSQNLILLGIRETLEKELGADYPAVVETAPVDNARNFSPEESIRDIFLDSEDMPDILVCLNAVYTRCAYQAAVDYNKVGTVQMLGYYDSDTILNAVAKNIVYSTIAVDTEQMGRFCVEALNEYLDTGYTNSYLAVDTRLIREQDALELLEEKQPGG